MKRAAIISGGGNRGAYFAGWMSVTKPEYEAVYGNSAGANMAINVALGMYDELAQSYSTLTNKDIWKQSPLRRNGKLSWLKSAWGMLTQNGAGDMSSHRDYLEREITEEMWGAFKRSGKEVKVAYVSFSYEPIKLFVDPLHDWKIKDYALDAIHYSSAFWPMAKPVNGTYADGGHLETALIDEALKDGYAPDEIDVYMCRVQPITKHVGIPKNAFQTAWRIATGSRHAIVYEDLYRAIDAGRVLKKNVHWLPEELPGNSMNFDPAAMTQYVEKGKSDANFRRDQGKSITLRS